MALVFVAHFKDSKIERGRIKGTHLGFKSGYGYQFLFHALVWPPPGRGKEDQVATFLDFRKNLFKKIRVGGGFPVLRITHMNMCNGSPCLMGLDRVLCNFVRGDGKILALSWDMDGTGNCCCDDNLAH